MDKLKQRWKLTSNFQVLLILIVFSINGTVATFIAKPLTDFIGLSAETTNAFIFWPVRILLIFLFYQITLPFVAMFFGQFKFFYNNFTKKMLLRLKIISNN